MIKACNLTKNYGDTLAVDDISFDVETNKVTGFLGPNGAGKSTTMRMMLGLDKGRGTTKFDGKELHDFANPAKVVGLLLEMKAFHPTRTAKNHLRVLAASSGVPDKNVDEALDMVGITEVAHKKPGNFSLGMSQRLGLAAAILTKPKYLLLDEPANGLDPEGMAWLRKFMKDYATDGRAVFVSSHLLGEMSQMADNLIVIGRGRLIVSSPIKKLMSAKSSSVFVRAKNAAKLQTLLKKQDLKHQKQANGYMVRGVSPDKLGELLHKNKLVVFELTPRELSLEDIFLQITSGAQEFQTTAQERRP